MARGWVIAHTEGGLGNRLRALLGSLSYAELIGARFGYVWPRQGFGAGMDDLWSFPHALIPTAFGRVLRVIGPRSDENVPPSLERRWVRSIHTDQELRLPGGATPWERHLQALQPAEGVQKRVRSAWGDLAGRRYIGVMVRAHPSIHAVTEQTSSVDWFIRRMREIRELDPETRFFLSCDEPGAQQRVLTAVPGTVACPKAGGYNTRVGLEEAVADLYVLASASYLIGPYWSSFIVLAHKLADEAMALETPMSHCQGRPPDLRPVAIDPLRPAVRAP